MNVEERLPQLVADLEHIQFCIALAVQEGRLEARIEGAELTLYAELEAAVRGLGLQFDWYTEPTAEPGVDNRYAIVAGWTLPADPSEGELV